MKRNGLVFVPPETPKRVILYPAQDLANQQQHQLFSGQANRARTAVVINHPSETVQPTTNNIRLVRQHPLSSPPNGTNKLPDKSNNDETAPTTTGQQISANMAQKGQNPYYANPFFRPKIATNQPTTTTANGVSTSGLNRDSSVVTTTIRLQTSTPSTVTNTLANRGKPSVYPPTQNPLSFSTGRAGDSEITVITSPNHDDVRRWAHSVGPASIARRVLNDERPNGIIHSSTSNITNTTNIDSPKQKRTSVTDLVISLMDPLRGPVTTNGSPAINVVARNVNTRDDSIIPEPTPTANDNAAGSPSSATTNNNQSWRKTLLANFQKNSRNMPSAKIFQSKQVTATSANIEPILNQQSKSERPMVLNGTANERTFQASEPTPTIPSLIRKSTESLRILKQENTSNNNNNIERSTSLQVPPSTFSNSLTNSTINPPKEIIKSKELSNPDPTPHIPIPIPSALMTGKPSVSAEQQRAIITRVMIRRDFVKSTESKPPMPAAANARSLVPPQSAKPGGLPTNNVVQPTTIAETSNINTNTNRMYQSAQTNVPLSQKSLLSFTPINPMVKDSLKIDHHHHQQHSNSTNHDNGNAIPTSKMSPSQLGTHHGASFRSTSLSAANAESRRKKEELFISKAKKRSTSASGMSTDGMLEKDAFEMEDEEYEAELEEESVRSSESDVDIDNTVSLDPSALLSDKVRRVGNAEVKSGFIPSLFSNVPPTIRFCTESQRIEQLPLPLRKMMKWKMSTITPNIVKNTVIRSGFRLIGGDEGNDWLGTWSRHMKPICFKSIREYQKVNHFPGSFQIGRKDRLWRNLSHMQAVHSRREFDFVPQTFVLPADFLLFKRVFDELSDTKESKWIIKPPASARGQGIRVISKMEHVPKKRPVIVQKYIANPYLINGHKFDLRLYVYVTSHDPLRIYLFDDGLARFASRKYSTSVKSLSDRFMHLTNYSINRYNSEYKTNNDSGACTGHKWSLKALWTYLKKRDVDVPEIIERIKDLIVKTIISADAYINVLTKANVRRKFCVHELFGFDVILDEQCKPYIVEVNISPSLHSNSPLDISVKGSMISDLLNLSGFMIPDRRDILFEGSVRRKPKLPKSLIFDRRILPQASSTDEKIKHQYFTQRYHDEQVRRNILDVLTPDDLRILIETEDEFARRGSFERLFPTNQTRKYLKYFETPRYYNLLLNEWIAKYHRMEERGIALLNTFCKKGIHLQHPATDAAHLWTQYQKLQGHLSHRDHDHTNTNGS